MRFHRNGMFKFEIHINRKNGSTHKHFQKNRGSGSCADCFMSAFAALAQLLIDGDESAEITIYNLLNVREADNSIKEYKLLIATTGKISLRETYTTDQFLKDHK